MPPSLENLFVLTWLRLVHSDLPALVKQFYSTKLYSRSLASVKPENSQALDSHLEEVRSTAAVKILLATVPKLRPPSARAHYNTSQQPVTKSQVKFCSLCNQAGPNDHQFLRANPAKV